jgi:hypothetical protein
MTEQYQENYLRQSLNEKEMDLIDREIPHT